LAISLWDLSVGGSSDAAHFLSPSDYVYLSVTQCALFFAPKRFSVRERKLSVVDINPNICFYLLPDSAQIFFRKALIHNNFKKIVFIIVTIADYAGLTDNNPWNLTTTVETNVLEQLRVYGYIDSYEKVGEDP